MENQRAIMTQNHWSDRPPHGARLSSSWATGLSGQASKPHSSSVETTFSAVSAITNHTAARPNAALLCSRVVLTCI
jgi:hypothetical protein